MSLDIISLFEEIRRNSNLSLYSTTPNSKYDSLRKATIVPELEKLNNILYNKEFVKYWYIFINNCITKYTYTVIILR